MSRGDSECSSERRPCTTREQEREIYIYIHPHTHRERGGSTKHKGWEGEYALHVRASEHVCVARVLVACLRECARAR